MHPKEFQFQLAKLLSQINFILIFKMIFLILNECLIYICLGNGEGPVVGWIVEDKWEEILNMFS
jgi:hypothetical protein